MEIKTTLTNRSGQVLGVEYKDIDSTDELGGRKVAAVHAYCFHGDKLVIVYSEGKGYWSAPGGGTEEGESVEESTIREILEETNMRVLKYQLLGFQDIYEPGGVKTQTRAVCIVEPVGPFVADGDTEGGDVTEIKSIDPADIKEYFDWGEVGEHVLARALEWNRVSKVRDKKFV